MGHKKDKTDTNTTASSNKELINNIICTIIASLFVSGIVSGIGLAITQAKLSAQMIYVESNIAELKDDIDSLQKSDTETREQLSALSALPEQIKQIQDFLYSNVKLVPANNAMPSLRSNDGIFLLSSPGWTSTDIIATDDVSGKEFTASELVNQKLLFPYIGDNDEEVYFYGQYNENNHWDETCIINVYKNNTLILITEATYDDGNLLNYKQAIPSEDDVNSWIISERANQGNLNIGDSWKYMSEKDYIKDFTFETVTATDIFSVNSFNTTLNAKLKEYYHGNTSDGYYNDDTGEAYFVSYMDNGTVKTLYVGNFKDGRFYDNTGNAWYITREENTTYMYFKGSFKDGIAQHNSTSVFENNLTPARIQELINGKSYNCDLNWFDTNSSKPA